MEIVRIPVLSDNYVWLVHEPESRETMVVDPAVAAPGGGTAARLSVTLDSDELLAGVDGITEGLPEGFGGMELPKFRDSGLLICHAGGGAGLFSAIIGGWVNGEEGSDPVSREIT